jgi:hypothetical protein
VLPLAFCSSIIDRADGPNPWRAIVSLAFYGLLFVSLRNAFLHIGTSYNYGLDLGRLSNLVSSPANWSYLLSSVFPNAANLPLLWFFEGLLGLVATAMWWAAQRSRGSQ